MGTKQIEYGEGRVWSFYATANITSGQVVHIKTGTAYVKPVSAASQHVLGVALVPASNGNQVSVIMEGIVKVQTTGVGSVVGGDLFGSGAGGFAAERTWGSTNERRLDLGVAIENAARNAKAKMKLLW